MMLVSSGISTDAVPTGHSPGDQITWASERRLTAFVRLPAVSLCSPGKSNGLSSAKAERRHLWWKADRLFSGGDWGKQTFVHLMGQGG